MEKNRTYIAIDLKSFYASVECVERGLDPLNTHLVVADINRTQKTICLAVSPSLKTYGISGRARLYEVVSKISGVNNKRRICTRNGEFSGKSYLFSELLSDKSLEVDYIVAPPQMAKYMEISTKIYGVYLKYIAPEDIHVYSIDEVFIDVTNYLFTYKMSAKQIASMLIKDVLEQTGITATVGIGTNLFLAKVAMDIVAKKIPPDKDGVRIAGLDEISYRKLLWEHQPLTDFWRVGKGYAKKLNDIRLFTMGDIARFSLQNEDKLYKLFGVNAELLIDHAWGFEPCTIADIKSYKPQNNSISSGQVLKTPYKFSEARLVASEMADVLALDLVEKNLVTNQIVLSIGYDIENVDENFTGEVVADVYGRKIPKPSHGSKNLKVYSSSSKVITEAVLELFDKIVDKKLLLRRINIGANRVILEKTAVEKGNSFLEIDLFTDFSAVKKEEEELSREKNMQKSMISIKKK